MNLRKIDLNLLTVFDAVMQERNLTRAAERIGMSQPAVSDAVGRLRHVLKDDLFVRTGHGVRPTPRAQQYAGQIARILEMVTLMLVETQSFDIATSQRPFNLVLSDYGELVVLPALMRYLEERQSQARVHVLSQHRPDHAQLLRNGTLDLVLTPEPVLHDEVISERVVTESLVCMVRRGHPLVRDKLSLEQFLELRHVILEWPDARGSLVEQRLRALGLQRNCHMHVHSFFDMPRVVASTDMVCSIPSRMAEHFGQSHDLVAFPIPLENLDVYLSLSWYRQYQDDPANAWIRRAVIALLEKGRNNPAQVQG